MCIFNGKLTHTSETVGDTA